MLYEHFHRYLWAAGLAVGRRVLDLGSGEGFGAAILARSAEDVMGVDIDPQAVTHAGANYARENLRFLQASALDLSCFPDTAFDLVVAFEVIEHIENHEAVIGEIARVLADDGLLVISTPDRDLYSQATGQVNSFHEHELTQAEFRELLQGRFQKVAMWGQRTVTGSYLRALEPAAGEGRDFFVQRDETGLHTIPEPSALFCIALASRVELPALGSSSTLADYGLELLHETARAHARAVAERDGLLGEVNGQLADANRMLDEKREEVLAVAARLSDVEAQLLRAGDELAEAQRFVRRVESSVSWQIFQRCRSTLYGTIGEGSALARALRGFLEGLGRVLFRGRSG